MPEKFCLTGKFATSVTDTPFGTAARTARPDDRSTQAKPWRRRRLSLSMRFGRAFENLGEVGMFADMLGCATPAWHAPVRTVPHPEHCFAGPRFGEWYHRGMNTAVAESGHRLTASPYGDRPKSSIGAHA